MRGRRALHGKSQNARHRLGPPRLARLRENEKRVLAAAAVIGRSFSFQLLTATSQIDVDELFTVIEKAQQMGIIVPSSEGPEQPFTFAHELVRQTLLAGISAPRNQQLHAAVADAIELLFPDAANERAGAAEGERGHRRGARGIEDEVARAGDRRADGICERQTAGVHGADEDAITRVG